MALWTIYQKTLTLADGHQDGPGQYGYLIEGGVDDNVKNLQNEVLKHFGVAPSERNAVRYESPEDGIWTAVIQWSPQNKQGWARDASASGDYIVTFTAVRQA